MAMIDSWRQAGQGFRTGGQISACSPPSCWPVPGWITARASTCALAWSRVV